MLRYIEEDAVYGLFNKSGRASLHVGDIDVLPRADVEPVVHGRWKKTAYSGVSRCSCCDKPSSTPDCLDEFFSYCPNCGAKMDAK